MTQDGGLFDAIKKGDGEAVDRLLDADPAALTVRDADGISPVLIALYYAKPDVAQRLLARQPTLDVFEAAATGDVARLRELLDDEPTLIDAWSVDGYQALGLACYFGHADAAALLLDRGAAHDQPSRNAMAVMPLHSAASGRHADIAQLLIDRGADVAARSNGDFTALHSAAQNGDAELVRILLAAGADAGASMRDGRTPADLAAAAGHDVVAAMLRGGAAGGD
jgi:ankyrin repeat protein